MQPGVLVRTIPSSRLDWNISMAGLNGERGFSSWEPSLCLVMMLPFWFGTMRGVCESGLRATCSEPLLQRATGLRFSTVAMQR